MTRPFISCAAALLLLLAVPCRRAHASLSLSIGPPPAPDVPDVQYTGRECLPAGR